MELQFLSMLSQICRAFPREEEAGLELICKRPQCFAVLKYLEDLDSNNLDKNSARYVDAPYFFSYRWEDAGKNPASIMFSYPMVAVTHQPFKLGLGRNYGKNNRATYGLAWLDQKAYSKKECKYCQDRTFEEYAFDAKAGLQMIIDQMQYWFLVQNDSTGAIAFAHESQIPADFREVLPAIDLLAGDSIESDFLWDAYNDNVCGLFTTITVDYSICKLPTDGWSYTAQSVVSVYDPNCESC